MMRRFDGPAILVLLISGIVLAITLAFVSYLVYAIYLALAWSRSPSILTWIGSWQQGGYLVAGIGLASMVAIITWNYRTNPDAVSRAKIRWVVFATLVSGGSGLFLWILPPLFLGYPLIQGNVLGVLLLFFPISIAIAIFRHQLFDIDVILHRTLVYGALTFALGLVYFSCVLGFQSLFVALTGQQSAVAIVLSTLVMAVLFDPLRKRIQSGIDRRFYRRKYNAEQALQAFAAQLREEVDLEQLSSHLINVVRETMQPEGISLWLREPGERLGDSGRILSSDR